jgi:hypothetical protein
MLTEREEKTGGHGDAVLGTQFSVCSAVLGVLCEMFHAFDSFVPLKSDTPLSRRRGI